MIRIRIIFIRLYISEIRGKRMLMRQVKSRAETQREAEDSGYFSDTLNHLASWCIQTLWNALIFINTRLRRSKF